MKLLRCADSGVLVELANLDEVLALYATLSKAPPPGVVELVPASRTLLLRLAPPGTARELPGGAGRDVIGGVAQAVRAAWERVRRYARDHPADRPPPATTPEAAAGPAAGELIEVPVRYDGPDLAEVGEITGLGAEGVVSAHTGRDWTVAFCGFAPGFGYLVGGDRRLQVPRRPSSRTKVPTGAVGLAGEFSGVYPRESPGGWQLIGHTTLRTFDLDRDPPALLRPGVRVRFTAVPR